MVYFQSKSTDLGKFWRALEWKMLTKFLIIYDHLEHYAAIWYNLWQFGIVCGHLVYIFPFWYVWTKKNLATLGQTLYVSSLRSSSRQKHFQRVSI
jgi:hypothetical protein